MIDPRLVEAASIGAVAGGALVVVLGAFVRRRGRRRTWDDLSAFVAAESLTAGFAMSLAKLAVSERRKREVAAFVAEEVMSEADALSMLTAESSQRCRLVHWLGRHPSALPATALTLAIAVILLVFAGVFVGIQRSHNRTVTTGIQRLRSIVADKSDTTILFPAIVRDRPRYARAIEEAEERVFVVLQQSLGSSAALKRSPTAMPAPRAADVLEVKVLDTYESYGEPHVAHVQLELRRAEDDAVIWSAIWPMTAVSAR